MTTGLAVPQLKCARTRVWHNYPTDHRRVIKRVRQAGQREIVEQLLDHRAFLEDERRRWESEMDAEREYDMLCAFEELAFEREERMRIDKHATDVPFEVADERRAVDWLEFDTDWASGS